MWSAGGVVDEEVVAGDVKDLGEADERVGGGGDAAVFIAADLGGVGVDGFGEVAWANNPLVYTDPSGMREAVAPLQPIKDADKDSAPEWVVKKAKDTVRTAWNTSFGASTTGYCGDLSIDFVISFEAQGCFVDDGDT